jgi:diguanylate cyclase (GGDEF)-like protein
MIQSYVGTVLVVDDLRDNLEVLEHVLKSNNYKVLLAPTGMDALELLKQNRPDLIMLDLMMPEMDGFEVCKRIKASEKTSNIPILFLSSNMNSNCHLKGLELGASDYVIKPFNKEILLKKVAQFINIQKQIHGLDPLTKLPNRESMLQILSNDILPDAEKNSSEIAVLTLNLSRFKFINDTYGRSVGNKILVEAAERGMKYLKGKGLLARTGGDEFTFILHHFKSLLDFKTQVKLISQALSEPYFLKKNTIRTKFNIGAAFYPKNGLKAERLLQCSMRAMYRSKQSFNLEYVEYSVSIGTDSSSNALIEKELYSAFLRRDFELHYQPQYEIASKEYSGFESLIRWDHKDFGWIPPSAFIPIAERNGMIVDIGNWVIEEAIRFYAQNAELLQNKRLSINVSPSQLYEKSFIPKIRELTQNFGIHPALIEYEITEGLMIENKEKALQILNAIKEIGSRVAIDDFGTGFSALTCLKFMPIDTLKLDKSFMVHIPNDKKDKAIVSAMISLAKNLELDLVVEGVENESQLNFLKDQNCDMIQGYYFSKPIPGNDLIRLLNSS